MRRNLVFLLAGTRLAYDGFGAWDSDDPKEIDVKAGWRMHVKV